MWTSISRIFARRAANTSTQPYEHISTDMDENFVNKQAKQRASVKWLLSKAFNNKVPDNLKEPFYKDNENQDHLKPQIVGSLANAEYYGMALSNIYSDPNYHSLNHWAILQALARKGVYTNEPSDAQLTETTLIQTNPLRMSAHMAVIESIMILYAKEVVTGDRVGAAVQRFGDKSDQFESPENAEHGLFLWLSHAGRALRNRMESEHASVGQNELSQNEKLSNGQTENEMAQWKRIPTVIRNLKDLSDGVALAALVAYYCPDELPFCDVRVPYVSNVQDSMHNLNLVHDFCQRCLPNAIFHITPEDITYYKDAMRSNVIVFLADLFNVVEIHPANCVKWLNVERPNKVSRSMPPSIPVRKMGLSQQSLTDMSTTVGTSILSEDSLRRNSDDSTFVVHRGKNIPTLRSVAQQQENGKLIKYLDEGSGGIDMNAAGKPSNWEENRKTSYAGRRSRRNSVSEDSQLTIENFGGSQDNINFIGRNPDKEVGAHVNHKLSVNSANSQAATATPPSGAAVAIRSSLQDARGSIRLGYEQNGCENEEINNSCSNSSNVRPATYHPSNSVVSDPLDNNNDFGVLHKLKRQLSNDDISALRRLMKQQSKENYDANNSAVLPNNSSQNEQGPQNNESTTLSDNELATVALMMNAMLSTNVNENFPAQSSSTNNVSDKMTSFAALPNNTTTWQQQSNNLQHQNLLINNTNRDNEYGNAALNETSSNNLVNAAQLNDVRMKLEEKRRVIENEKRRMELALNKQRQKVGKQAFLQAVTKEIQHDTAAVQRKWFEDQQPFIENRRTPELENMDLDQYQHSIAQMNSSLNDIQSDIQRLASQQQQYQQMYALPQQYQLSQSVSSSSPHIPNALYHQQHPGMLPDQHQFYLHENSSPQVPQRRTWAQQPQHVQMSPMQVSQTQMASSSTPLRTWSRAQSTTSMRTSYQEPQYATLHNDSGSAFIPSPRQNQIRQNGDATSSPHQQQHVNTSTPLKHSNSFTLSQQHYHQQQQPFILNSSQNGSPTHNNVSHHMLAQRQLPPQFLNDEPIPSSPYQPQWHQNNSHVNLQQIASSHNDSSRHVENNLSVHHTSIPAPSVDDMEPQNISFIGNSTTPQMRDEQRTLNEGLSRLNITSGNRTYRIPSPTRSVIGRTSFQQLANAQQSPIVKHSPQPSDSNRDKSNSISNEKGFYIKFDDEQPKRPKPPLRTKRASPRKDKNLSATENLSKNTLNHQQQSPLEKHEFGAMEKQVNHMESRDSVSKWVEESSKLHQNSNIHELNEGMPESKNLQQLSNSNDGTLLLHNQKNMSALIIGSDLKNPDPDVVDERERKKERIMMLSLQRRQEQEELKARKELEMQARKEREKQKEEEKARKKEEQIARRAAILEQYKLKKAIEEAEREGKVLDKTDLLHSLRPNPKMRPKSAARPRPKTIHIDSGSVEMAEGLLPPSSRGKKGSTSNLTAIANTSMKRDYYRGSQDSLADRSVLNASTALLYQDSPDNSRGISPCQSANPTLGRRSSYKNSRGSSSDQDSYAYRYGDTDSGLGRATPPRRAPSPGMNSLRHLTSPSGPGSLPGFMTKGRRIFDDGSGDISSTASSMMDYHGPRLYKQPTTKSNRGIMLNAVEYCVFPGVVNRDAKKRVLEEINRSESKHFLILFRDAGCQFRALYSYCPDRDEILKLYGTGPKQVNDCMFDKFFKYNSGGKCFSQVHTKHLTVTIDAFTIHNSLWQGKKVNLPNKKDMALVI